MADYQGKNVVIIGLGLTGLSCVDFFLASGVTPRVMDTRMTPPQKWQETPLAWINYPKP